MKISLYTAMRDCISNDYPFVDMLRHHLPLADEIIIDEGFSTDGTYESIRDLDPKIKIFRHRWEAPTGENWWIHFKDAARRRCTGDWCIHLDCDEFIPEWEFEDIRRHLASTSDVLIPTVFYNFYGNYRVYHADPARVNWITRKMIIHRNVDEVEFWGDGSNLRLKGQPFPWDTASVAFTVHHFGGVRDAATLREAWWWAGRFRTGRSIRFRPPKFLFRWFPHDWKDPYFLADLATYNGPYIKAIELNRDRFVRDGMKLFDLLKGRPRRTAPYAPMLPFHVSAKARAKGGQPAAAEPWPLPAPPAGTVPAPSPVSAKTRGA